VLHHLNELSPDGGSRIPEAEAAYRAALDLAAASASADALITIRGNLGALLLNGGRVADAIAELDEALAAAARLGRPESGTCALAFNRGKALAAAGRLDDADAAYLGAARAAAGRDLATYGKALAALEALPAADAAAAAKVRARRRQRPCGCLQELSCHRYAALILRPGGT
jgi:tetratricopeptide (TPR) repeat protein